MMLSFIYNIYRNQKKSYHLLLLIITMMSLFEFCFLAMYDAFTQFQFDITQSMIFNAIPVLSTFIALILTIYISKFFIENKKQEFSILLLCGRTPKDLFKYMIIQFGLLCLISFLLGAIGGIVMMAVINMFLTYFHFHFTLNYHLWIVILYYLCFLIFTIIFILAISTQQFVALDVNVAKTLTHKESMDKPVYQIQYSATQTKKKTPLVPILITLLACFMVVSAIQNLLNPSLSMRQALISYAFILCGEVFLVNISVPLLYDIGHHYLLEHPLLMNAMSSFMYFSKVMFVLLNLNAIVIPTTLSLFLFNSYNEVIQAVLLPCFVMILIMIYLCFLLRFSIYLQHNQQTVKYFYTIGYSYSFIQKIYTVKNTLFCFIGLIIPLAFMSILLYILYSNHILSDLLIISLMIAYICIYGILFIYFIYKEKHSIKEVVFNDTLNHRSA